MRPSGASSGFAAIMAGKVFLSVGTGVWGSLIIGALVGLGCGIGNGLLVTVEGADAHDSPSPLSLGTCTRVSAHLGAKEEGA